MFLKRLKISNINGVIRDIRFRKGLNLIVDETVTLEELETGNNVGKTTVLMLIDFCLGGNAKNIYIDNENKKNENAVVKRFLIETEALITLTLTDDLEKEYSRDLVIERNFLSRKNLIRRINGEQKTEDEFEETLTNSLIPGHYGKKPTFRQIISHNIRYKDLSINNTLKTLDPYTRDDEYETLYLFLLGCNFDQGDAKQNLLSQIRTETTFKSRLESKQTRSAYEAALSLITEDIKLLNEKKSTFNVNLDFEKDLKELNEIKYRKSSISSALGRLKIRRNLIEEASRDIISEKSSIDTKQLKELYSQAASRLENIQKSFEDLLDFHNKMVDEKVRYISKEIPSLDQEIKDKQEQLGRILIQEAELAKKIAVSDSFEELENLIIEINEKYRKMGEYEATIRQIEGVDENLKSLNKSLQDIEESLFSTEFGEIIKTQLNHFNKHFSSVSQFLYGEQYALKFDLEKNKQGKRIYKFSAFNTNFSSGKKQGEICCFDIAYTKFADEEGIPCYHFLLNDKKELMHDNQLVKISELVEREDSNIQFVASILKDKLPEELKKEEYFIIKLSQNDKLFRVEMTEEKD